MARRPPRGYDARMSSRSEPWNVPGPFRADQLNDGDPYELSNGHAIRCMTAGHRHGSGQNIGGSVLAYDPGVAGTVSADTGISFNDGKNLRAPDLSVGLPPPQGPGWATTAPPLAVEYADSGQNEDELKAKITELLAFGTRVIWVVRLVGPLRVEIHEQGRPVRTAGADDVLHAEGILANPVPVRALVDHSAARKVTLQNILNFEGYRDLDHVREEGREKGLEEALTGLRNLVLAQITSRGWILSPALQARLDACSDQPTLVRWYAAVTTSTNIEAALR